MKALKEIHEIMEKIYSEEKGLSAQERAKRTREESEKFLKERKINLRHAPQKETVIFFLKLF